MLERIAFLASFPQAFGLMKNAKILKDLEVTIMINGEMCGKGRV
jgi:hypothetical protein